MKFDSDQRQFPCSLELRPPFPRADDETHHVRAEQRHPYKFCKELRVVRVVFDLRTWCNFLRAGTFKARRFHVQFGRLVAASSRPSCRANSPSTARRRCRRSSGSTPHDILTATAPKNRSPVRPLLSRRQGARSNAAFITPIFRHRPARRSDRRLTSRQQRHSHRSLHRGADLSRCPSTAKSP